MRPCSNQKRIQFLSRQRESERRERIRYYTPEGGRNGTHLPYDKERKNSKEKGNQYLTRIGGDNKDWQLKIQEEKDSFGSLFLIYTGDLVRQREKSQKEVLKERKRSTPLSLKQVWIPLWFYKAGNDYLINAGSEAIFYIAGISSGSTPICGIWIYYNYALVRRIGGIRLGRTERWGEYFFEWVALGLVTPHLYP